MKKKIFSILFALVLVLSFSLVTAVPAAAVDGIWYVDDSVASSGDGKTLATAFKTIQEGVTAASPSDTINVAAGTYDEAVPIGKQLTLLGAQHGVDPTAAGARTDEAAESIIKGTGVGHLVDISADGVTVDGFTITGATGHEGNGIRINGASDTTIENNIITGNNADGISTKWADNNLIQNNVIVDNALAVTNFMIDCWRANGINIQYGGSNIVKNNVVSGQYNGIYLTGSRGPSVGNTLTGNTIEDNSEFGILLAGGRNIDNTITSCDIKGSRVGIYQRNGIPLGWGWKGGSGPNTGNEAHHNNIVGNTDYGVQNFDTDGVETFDATLNWWGSATGPVHASNPLGTGDPVSANVLFAPWLKAPYRPTTSMSSFTIDHAKVDFKKKADDDKVRVQGTLALGLDSDGVVLGEDVIVTVGLLSETITMVEKGKKGEKWQYKRPKGSTGDIKHMTINWKNGKFDFSMDKVDLSELTDPDEVTISIQIGDDLGKTTISMTETKHWDYKAK